MTTPPIQILELIDSFRQNYRAYKLPNYNETQTRHEFIDPFFEALGWDINNQKKAAPAYREVIHEDSIQVGAVLKAPDYSFRVGTTRKFFIEAKKPSVNIYQDTSPAFQLRRYGWSAQLPLSILTDFEEFAVYDCRVMPNKEDSAAYARLDYIKYTEYAERWDEIAERFSREAVFSGSLDKYAEKLKVQKGTTTVDAAFLKAIETWREILAQDIARRNPQLSQRDLNFAVQITLDRMIFLRICEDRNIEPYGQLESLNSGSGLYEQLIRRFRAADLRYNSGLFHFEKEKGRDDPDGLTLTLSIGDNPLKQIIQQMYYPNSPYVFNVIPVEILGQVYEQFLGKVIALNSTSRSVVIEEKPEVRKAGGVFYTPSYIVDYIVKNTVGQLLEGKDPDGVAKLKILDPSCGSGSFLLGAYQFLLDWHLRWYSDNNPSKQMRTKKIYQGAGEEWRLTTTERKRILLNNIYGVDIDNQAVETTKLSLLLKVLEGETGEGLAAQLQMFRERALPNLESNIKCGNSLIGPDFYSQQSQQMAMFDEEEQYRLNIFDWQADFSSIMKDGGFDAIIGNPPYGAFFSEFEKLYIRERFRSYKYKYDSYIYFIDKALGLTKERGYVSFITPELWLKLENCQPLRQLIAEESGFELLRICGENVFVKVVVNTIVFVLHKSVKVERLRIESQGDSWVLPSAIWKADPLFAIDYRLRPDNSNLVAKIKESNSQPLAYFGDIIQGITPYDRYTGQDADLIKKRGYHYSYKHDETCGKWLAGKDVVRYKVEWSGEWLSYGDWLAAPREARFFRESRLLFREVPGKNKRIQAAIAEEICYHGHSITPFKPFSANKVHIYYLLGIVNSRILSWFGELTLPNFGKNIFPKLNPQDIKALLIRTINFADPTDKARHDQVVSLVEKMLELHQRLTTARTTQEKTLLQRQIDATDQQIDRLVYELYDLTDEEIKIVEGR
ncbi:MAG: N-6 DNA methylase [Chloroflexi bacterium]|nr:N-6 DNA methylase [Chloroflexota bacterium]